MKEGGIMQKYILVVVILLLVFTTISEVYSMEVSEFPDLINIKTDPSDCLDYETLEHVEYITVEEVAADQTLQIIFEANRRSDLKYIVDNIKIKYRISSRDDWYDWDKIDRPLLICFDHLNSAQDIGLELKLIIPQSLKVRKGCYSGQFVLEFI